MYQHIAHLTSASKEKIKKILENISILFYFSFCAKKYHHITVKKQPMAELNLLKIEVF